MGRAVCFAGIVILCFGVFGCPQRDPQPVAVRPGSCDACPAPAASIAYDGVIPTWLPVAGRTVILDPGHGGRDTGTRHFGLEEKDINLDLAERTAANLRARGVDVRLTRESDDFVSLPDRSAFANRLPGAVFVSVHVNASDKNPNASGIETFVLGDKPPEAERGALAAERYGAEGTGPARGRETLASLSARNRERGPTLAGSVQKVLVSRLGGPDRGVKKGNLAVLRETYFCPAALVEVGFLSHAPTARAMATEDWRRRTADALADGIVDYMRGNAP